MKLNIKQLKQQPINKIVLFNQILENKYFKDNKYPSITERILLVCDWQDLPAKEVESWSVKTVNQVVEGIITIVKTYTPEAPRKKIGDYTHRFNYTKFSVGHWKNIEIVDSSLNPSEFLALLYIEEGLEYGHEEKRGGKTVVVNPLTERAKEIEKQTNLAQMVDSLAFFLNISELANNSSVLNLLKMEKARRKAIL